MIEKADPPSDFLATQETQHSLVPILSLVAPCSIFSLLLIPGHLGIQLTLCGLALAMLLVAGILMTFYPKRKCGRIHCDGKAIRFAESVVAQLSDLQAASILPKLTDGLEVSGWEVLTHPQRLVSLASPHIYVFSQENEARAFVRSLGLSDRRALSLITSESRLPILGGMACFLLGSVLAFGTDYLSLLFNGAACIVMFALYGRMHIVVGKDGIFMRSLLRRRFLPLAEVEPGQTHQGTFRLKLTRGGTLRIEVRDAHALAAVEARIFRELASRDSRSSFDPTLDIPVQRQGRTAHEWLSDLRRVGSTGQYRVPAASLQSAIAVVEDPRHSTNARIAAAIILHSLDQHSAAGHLRAASRATANPRLRAAFQTVAEGADEAKLERCFESVVNDNMRS